MASIVWLNLMHFLALEIEMKVHLVGRIFPDYVFCYAWKNLRKNMILNSSEISMALHCSCTFDLLPTCEGIMLWANIFFANLEKGKKNCLANGAWEALIELHFLQKVLSCNICGKIIKNIISYTEMELKFVFSNKLKYNSNLQNGNSISFVPILVVLNPDIHFGCFLQQNFCCVFYMHKDDFSISSIY